MYEEFLQILGLGGILTRETFIGERVKRKDTHHVGKYIQRAELTVHGGHFGSLSCTEQAMTTVSQEPLVKTDIGVFLNNYHL